MIIKSLKSELEALGLLQECKEAAPVAPAGRMTDARGIFSRKRMARKLRTRFEEMATKIKREVKENKNDPGSRMRKLFEELEELTDEVIEPEGDKAKRILKDVEDIAEAILKKYGEDGDVKEVFTALMEAAKSLGKRLSESDLGGVGVEKQVKDVVSGLVEALEWVLEEFEPVTDMPLQGGQMARPGERTARSEPDRPERMESGRRRVSEAVRTRTLYDGMEIRVDLNKPIPEGKEREELQDYLERLISRVMLNNAENFEFDWNPYHRSVFVTFDLAKGILLTDREMWDRVEDVTNYILNRDRSDENWVKDVKVWWKPESKRKVTKDEDKIAYKSIRLCVWFKDPIPSADSREAEDREIDVVDSLLSLSWPKGTAFEYERDFEWNPKDNSLCAWIKFDRSIYLTPEEKEKLDKEFIQNMKEHFGASSIKDIWTEWHD